MTETAKKLRVGDWLVEPSLLRLSRDGAEKRVEPKVMDLLVLLATRAPEVVSRAEIFDVVWEGRAVVDAALSRAMSLLRQALDDDTQAPRYVETIATRGYRLIAEVREEAGEPDRRRGSPRTLVLAAVLTAVAAIALLVTRSPDPAERTPYPLEERPEIRSLAVLPFEEHSGDSAEPYFAVGLTEALITRFAQLEELRVISPTSAESFRGSPRAPTEIAAELGVAAVLEGSVIRAGDRVRVSARLVETASGAYLWADEYDRRLSDVLHLHAAISQAVVDAVRLRLTPREESALARSPEVDSKAYRLYLQGRFHWNRRTIADLERSVLHFRNALALDPLYAPAHAGLADGYVLLSTYYALPPAEAFPRARAAAERAVALDSELPAAHASLGAVRWSMDWDFAGAEDAYRRAIELGPGYATAHQWYAELLSVLGRHDEAVEKSRRALALDPLSPLMNAAHGQRLNAAGRWTEALAQFEHALELDPRFAWLRREMAYAETHLGRPERALEQRRLEMEARGVAPELLATLRSAIRDDGMRGFWRWELERLERRAASGFVPALLYAEAHEGAGERDRALLSLERAVEQRGDHVLQLATSPALLRLARDPRAAAMLTASGLGHLTTDGSSTDRR